MIRVRFQNGPDAPEIVLEKEFETRAEAESRLDWFAENFGTVEGAVAWIDGDKKPKQLVKAEEQLAETEAELAAQAEKDAADHAEATANQGVVAEAAPADEEPAPAPARRRR